MPPRIIPPVDTLGGIQRKILFCKSAFGLRGLCEPLHNRCIVVRTGIIIPCFLPLCAAGNRCLHPGEPELKNAHAGEARVFNKLMYLRCQETEIFRNER